MVYEIIKELENTPGLNDKQAILERNVDNRLLRQFFFMALNPHMMFGIKKIPEYQSSAEIVTLGEAMQELYKLVNREVTGNAAVRHLQGILSELDDGDQEVIERIIKKEPDCKVSYKIVNKVWKKLIPVTPYMRCASSNEKNYARINYPACVQKKANGMFLNILHLDGDIELQTRNGKPVELFDNLDDEIIVPDHRCRHFVIIGEALVLEENGEIMERKKGNGLLNKAIQGTITKDVAARVVIDVWDVIPYDEWLKGIDNTPYKCRLEFLEEITRESNKIQIIETKKVDSFEEAYKYFKLMIDDGEEGAVLKNFDGIWKDHTSPNQVKMKVKDPADLICVGTYPHKKHADWIGGLNLESSDGIIKVNTGSGLTHVSDDPNVIPDRLQPPSYFIGNIVELEYNEITEDKKTKQKSLFLPIYQCVRFDKSEADSYETILERSSYNKKKGK
jgi:ATP-dependent DNA ligase